MKLLLVHASIRRTVRKIVSITVPTVLVSFALLLLDNTASAAPWDSQLQVLADALTGTTGQILATLGIAGAGVLFLAGRIAIQHAALVVLGIALVFGASAIVGFFA